MVEEVHEALGEFGRDWSHSSPYLGCSFLSSADFNAIVTDKKQTCIRVKINMLIS